MSEEYYKKEAMVYFRSLINYKISNGKSTRPTNFAGHIGRHMKPDLKKWFLDKYPNNSDYVKFFLENDDVFSYDCMTGDVRLNSFVSKFSKPSHLSQLESRVTNANISLIQLSKRISELEFFLTIFRLFVDSYESNKTIDIPVDQLVALFNGQKYELIVKQIASMVSKDIGFNLKIVEYLRQYYDSVFIIDEQNNKISLRKSVINLLNKACNQIDDSVYVIFKALISKYLRCNGGKDVNQLKESICKRHEILFNYIFCRQHSDEYTLLDFLESYREEFVYKREVDSEGIVKRIINVRFGQKQEQKDNFNNIFDYNNSFGRPETQINNTGLKNCNNSENDEEIYFEEEEQVVDEDVEEVVEEADEVVDEEVVEEVVEEVDEVVAKKDENVCNTNASNNLIECCVCKNDVSDELISYSSYREWALKHNRCLFKKLVHSLKKECDKKLSALKRNEKEVQTVSTGNVRPRQGFTSNAYFHY